MQLQEDSRVFRSRACVVLAQYDSPCIPQVPEAILQFEKCHFAKSHVAPNSGSRDSCEEFEVCLWRLAQGLSFRGSKRMQGLGVRIWPKGLPLRV